MLDFLREKFGDAVGWEILHLGIGISVWGALIANEKLYAIGGGLITMGAMALKLRSGPAPAAPPAEPPA